VPKVLLEPLSEAVPAGGDPLYMLRHPLWAQAAMNAARPKRLPVLDLLPEPPLLPAEAHRNTRGRIWDRGAGNIQGRRADGRQAGEPESSRRLSGLDLVELVLLSAQIEALTEAVDEPVRVHRSDLQRDARVDPWVMAGPRLAKVAPPGE
jgi:hypothetical protein